MAVLATAARRNGLRARRPRIFVSIASGTSVKAMWAAILCRRIDFPAAFNR
ncbi:hypothetical protein ACCUM_0641 [Candidatus Accumulibacter phosphatis]|uniref:Uncharacterized protein n=1 Tax=Candidatus Accumulibacter phosphatis TaxID=327160 RepID=A0A5S4EK80_9PROT|nr:hypothetical protein ACCUM_0641 [Candidatus Accumulibacter phosphatis]